MLSLCPEPPCTVPRQPSLAFSLPPSSRQVLTGPELSFPEPGGQEALWRLDSDPAGWGELPLTSPGDSLFFCTGSGGISWDLTAPLFALGEESKFPNVPEELGAKAQEKCGWGTVGMSLPLPSFCKRRRLVQLALRSLLLDAKLLKVASHTKGIHAVISKHLLRGSPAPGTVLDTQNTRINQGASCPQGARGDRPTV